MTENRVNSTLFLFDVDGTLTKPRQLIDDDHKTFLFDELPKHATVGLVGGSDLTKICEQLGFKKSDDLVNSMTYVFSENGLVAHKNGELIGKMSIAKHLGEDKCQELINFCLQYMSNLTLPVKRGTFIEFRSGLINICPVGRSCSQQERDQFNELDMKEQIRPKFRDALYSRFPDMGLDFAIGGQISLDAFPVGWDKRFALQYVENKFENIYFFGDKTAKGGNDHEIFEDDRTIGYTVEGPDDTFAKVKDLLNLRKLNRKKTNLYKN